MNLSVTSGMEKNTVFCLVAAPVSAPNNVVVVPASKFGDFMVADGTETVLFFPEPKQLAALSEIDNHFETKTLLKIGFPFRVVRVSLASDFRMPLDRSISGTTEPDDFAVQLTVKHPVAIAAGLEVFGLYPTVSFIGMSPFRPLPHCLEDGAVYFAKGSFAADVLVIVGPALYFRVEDGYQVSSRGLRVALDDFSEVGEECLDVLL